MSLALEAATGDKLTVIQTMAVTLMNQHGLTDWTFEWDHAKVRAGLCRRTRKTISLSKHLMSIWDLDQARDIILHEIAHALTKGGHNREWRVMCVNIGADPARCWDGTTNASIPPKYMGVCVNGHTTYRHRKPRKPVSCGRCSKRFDSRYLLQWTEMKGNQ